MKAKEKRAQTKRQKTIAQQAEAATFWARHIAQQDGEPAAIRFVGKTRFPKEIYERLLVRTGSQRRLVLQEKATPNRSTVVVVDVGTPTLQDENLIPPGRLGKKICAYRQVATTNQLLACLSGCGAVDDP